MCGLMGTGFSSALRSEVGIPKSGRSEAMAIGKKKKKEEVIVQDKRISHSKVSITMSKHHFNNA